MANNTERWLTIISAIVTLFQAIVGLLPGTIENKPPFPEVNFIFVFSFFIYIFGAFANYLHTSPPAIKVAFFLISEAANGYFFAVIFNWLQTKNSGKIHRLFLIFIVIVFTCCISILFLKFLIFDGIRSQTIIWSFIEIFLFIIGSLVSLVITLVLFCWEHFVDKTKSKKGTMNEILGRVGSIVEKVSIWVLIVFYVSFCLVELIPFIFNLAL